MKKTVLFLLLFSLVSGFSFAQGGGKNPYMKHIGVNKTKAKVPNPWLDKKVKYARAGWFVEPGATLALGFKHEEELDGFAGTFKPGLRPAFYLGGGRYRIFRKGLITYLDYGLAWKQLKGGENFEGGFTTEGSRPDQFTGKGIFKENYGTAMLNFNNVQTVGRRHFVQNTLGLNFDYRFMQRNSYEGTNGPFSVDAAPNAMNLQLHYKFGWGFKASTWLLVIPQVETPVLNILPFEKFRSTHTWFSTKYRPLIFSVRFMFLRDANKNECPPVYGHPDDQGKQDALEGF